LLERYFEIEADKLIQSVSVLRNIESPNGQKPKCDTGTRKKKAPKIKSSNKFRIGIPKLFSSII